MIEFVIGFKIEVIEFMTKNVLYTLLGATMMLATATACDRASAPKEVRQAYVAAGVSDGATRALFVGGTNKDLPNEIKWGEIGDELPVYIFFPTSAQTQATSSVLKLKDVNKGTLTVPYIDDYVNDEKVRYFATSGANTTTYKGAVIGADSYSLQDKVFLKVGLPKNRPVDMSNSEVQWPLVSVPREADPKTLWSTVHTISGGGVNFNLFGNMFLIHFEKIAGDDTYDANSNDTNEAYLPQIIVESNGMAFAGSTFVKEVNKDVAVGSAISQKVIFSLKKMNFTAGAKRQVLPVWFRPYKPNGSDPFFFTITWRVYNKTTSTWDETVRTVKLPEGKSLAPNGTIFTETDGHYYSLKGGVTPKIGAEFGSNSFFEVEITPPAFD